MLCLKYNEQIVFMLSIVLFHPNNVPRTRICVGQGLFASYSSSIAIDGNECSITVEFLATNSDNVKKKHMFVVFFP